MNYLNLREQSNKCQVRLCSLNGCNTWIYHKLKLCNSWSATFHYSCNLMIDNIKEFYQAACMIISDLLQQLENEGDDFGWNKLNSKLIKDIENFKEKFNDLQIRFNTNTILFDRYKDFLPELK